MKRVMGVMNGTCNYILTRMQAENLPYEAVFEEARQLGYLEADPNLDVGGIDAGHKLSLLASIAFGTKVAFDAVELEGIGNVSIDDIRLAEDMGYRIKLLGVAQMTGRGLEQRMTPCLVPADSPLGPVAGRHQHGGAGRRQRRPDRAARPRRRHGPDRQRRDGRCDRHRPRLPPADLRPAGRRPTPAQPARAAPPAPYYLRMTLLDKPGALAKIATCLGEAGVSIDQMRQYGHRGHQRPGPDRHPQGRPDDIAHAMPALPPPACWSACPGGDPHRLEV
jgi:homoserine dehydrogenase